MNDKLLITNPDHLETPIIGTWAIAKYNLVYEYCHLFSTGMKNLWDTRVYIDLFCGPGKALIEKQNKYVNTSPILALSVPDKFDKYIFCDFEKKNIDALQERVSSINSENNVEYLIGDSNQLIDNIITLIPKPSKSNRVLTFCFVDPFSLCIEFETIKKLSNYFVDFLILLAFGMDGKRNLQIYIDENHKRIDNFLGKNDWRDIFKEEIKSGSNFTKFLADEFTKQMVKLGYKENAINNFIPIHSDEKNLSLYYLAFYSKNKKGYEFWEKVKKRNTEPELGFL